MVGAHDIIVNLNRGNARHQLGADEKVVQPPANISRSGVCPVIPPGIANRVGVERAIGIHKIVLKVLVDPGAFPDGQSALMLVCARLRYMQESLWGQKTYLNMQHLEELLPSDS